MRILYQPRESVSGKYWYVHQPDARQVHDLSVHHSIPEYVAHILVGRGLEQQVQDVLDPTLRRLMPDPSIFLGMDQAVERIHQAIVKRQKIVVFGDYDVDGGCSTALLLRYLRALGCDVGYYIPDRMREGYGPNVNAIDAIARQGIDLLITVDCGTTSYEPLQRASDLGMEVIVLDHHLTQDHLPKACAVVNPNRFDESNAYGYLCAAGVTFLFEVALQRRLRESGFFSDVLPPNLMHFLDMVALATVCDVVPMVGLNRALVRGGLSVLSQTQNLGLKTLMEISGVHEPAGAYHLGFVLGPRINAGGRVGESDLGVRLLTTENSAHATTLALRLDALNRERQAIEQTIVDAAMAQVMRDRLDQQPLIMVKDEGWHPGVIGIVASRLTERFGKPSVVVAVEDKIAGDKIGDDKIGKASGRSIKGIDLGAAILAAKQEGLLIQGGGHAMAGGFTMNVDGFEALHHFFNQTILAQHGSVLTSARPSMIFDAVLSLQALDMKLCDHLSQMSPFGSEHPEPKFILSDCRIAHSQIVGDKHIRVTLRNEWGTTLSAIAFRAVDTPLGQALLNPSHSSVHVAGLVRKNEWQGRQNVQFQILDIMNSDHSESLDND